MDTTQHTATYPTRLWAGVDLAKRTFAGAIWGHQAFQDRRVRSFPRTEEGIARFLDWLKAEAGPERHWAWSWKPPVRLVWRQDSG